MGNDGRKIDGGQCVVVDATVLDNLRQMQTVDHVRESADTDIIYSIYRKKE